MTPEKPTPRRTSHHRGLKEVHALLAVVFTSKNARLQWLNTPHPQFGGKSPADIIAGPSGQQRVTELVKAMIHGVPP